MNLTIVKFFVNATQQLLSLDKILTMNLNIVKFFVNTIQPLLSSGENYDYELNHS